MIVLKKFNSDYEYRIAFRPSDVRTIAECNFYENENDAKPVLFRGVEVVLYDGVSIQTNDSEGILFDKLLDAVKLGVDFEAE